MKTSILNLFRNLFKIGALEQWLVKRTIGKPAAATVCKMAPNHYQYKPGTMRHAHRNGFNFELDLNDLVDWHIYYGIRDQGRDALSALAKDGHTVADIGTNVGEVSLVLSKVVGQAGKVISFEPDPTNYGRFEKNLSLNDQGNIDPRNIGLGAEPGTLKLQVNTDNRGNNTISETGNVSIQISTLDHELAGEERLDLVKIDVEGFEHEVIKGGRHVISKFLPVLFIEIDDGNLLAQGSSPAALFKELEGLGYRLTHAETGKELRATSDLSGCHFDVICRPGRQ